MSSVKIECVACGTSKMVKRDELNKFSCACAKTAKKKPVCRKTSPKKPVLQKKVIKKSTPTMPPNGQCWPSCPDCEGSGASDSGGEVPCAMCICYLCLGQNKWKVKEYPGMNTVCIACSKKHGNNHSNLMWGLPGAVNV